ncbi:hypothetical protein QBC40DRAFT_96978 [Triangularia verruculosa]|uniref:Uncharacterized protein n=1 Tax=Triangularia verruculosa TaxID=2587418 RepID=A0AAN6XCP8_9PEZI|nr:hypothetical protein QBC40DRAFT_96978 [Triangularia verruculosa]
MGNTYFLVPGWGFPHGTITLGSVIINSMHPQLALFEPPHPVQVTTAVKTRFTSTRDDPADRKSGLFRTFLSLFGLGDEDGFHNDRKKPIVAYSIWDLQSLSFVPTDELKIKAIIETERVAQFLKASDNRPSVFMVTGIKSIRGASVLTASNKGPGWTAEIRVGLEKESREGKPVVFAFEVLQLRLSDTGDITTVSDILEPLEKLQRRLDHEFGEAAFTALGTTDEQTGDTCQVIAPSPAPVDLLTASSARIDASLAHDI